MISIYINYDKEKVHVRQSNKWKSTHTVRFMAPGSPSKNAGQPQPESNLLSDLYRGVPQPAQLYTPSALNLLYSPVPGNLSMIVICEIRLSMDALLVIMLGSHFKKKFHIKRQTGYYSSEPSQQKICRNRCFGMLGLFLLECRFNMFF